LFIVIKNPTQRRQQRIDQFLRVNRQSPADLGTLLLFCEIRVLPSNALIVGGNDSFGQIDRLGTINIKLLSAPW
jgi:hypothetical protein